MIKQNSNRFRLTKIFSEFFNSEKSGGIVLLICAVISLIIVNTPLQQRYLNFWHYTVVGNSLEHWINEGLMAVFFLLIGLELKRELYVGELSNVKNALLPVIGAIGGMIAPAGIYLLINIGTEYKSGAGIPTATDIAFSLGILSLLGKRIPPSLKIFLAALAVIDDLGAIIIIVVFYSSGLVWMNLGIALGVFVILLLLNKAGVFNLIPYILGGAIMWYFMSHSGVHATISGVLLAFAIPFRNKGRKSPSDIVQHYLHIPVPFIILPLFAIANTSVVISGNLTDTLTHPVSIGILAGLCIGKPLGITLISYFSVKVGICKLPKELNWNYIVGMGCIAGIGFTMSIFTTLLAFDQPKLIDIAKLMILFASLFSGIMGFIWLKLVLTSAKKPK